MAKKPKINKSQAVRDYLAGYPDAMPKEVTAALAREGVEVSSVLVSGIRGKLTPGEEGGEESGSRGRGPRSAASHGEARRTAARSRWIRSRRLRNDPALGGCQRVTDVLEVIKELGGVKKFKDLAEAMTATSTDAIPF